MYLVIEKLKTFIYGVEPMKKKVALIAVVLFTMGLFTSFAQAQGCGGNGNGTCSKEKSCEKSGECENSGTCDGSKKGQGQGQGHGQGNGSGQGNGKQYRGGRG